MIRWKRWVAGLAVLGLSAVGTALTTDADASIQSATGVGSCTLKNWNPNTDPDDAKDLPDGDRPQSYKPDDYDCDGASFAKPGVEFTKFPQPRDFHVTNRQTQRSVRDCTSLVCTETVQQPTQATSPTSPYFPPFTHFVIIVRENHTFDDYLGDAPRVSIRERRQQRASDLGSQERLTRGQHPHGADERLWRHVLEQEAHHARTQCAMNVLLIAECRQHGDRRRRQVPAHQLRRRQPVAAGHVDVQQQDIRPMALGQHQGLGSAARFRDDLDVLGGLQQAPDAGSDQWFVVRDDDRDHASPSFVVNRACTAKPPSLVGP
jgi:hypothetical protein